MRILLSGANGQVGWECQRHFAALGEIIALDRQQLDLENIPELRNTIQQFKPGLIVNAAAYTAVDKAENEPERAMMINALAPAAMAEEAVKLNIPLIHYSTDYVFDGEAQQPWREQDTPNPQNVYGKTKLAGELAIAETGVAHLILRTSWVVGARGHNFLLTMRRLATERDKLSVVNDQFGAPTWSADLADITAKIIAQGIDQIADKSGVYHLTSAGETSWHGVAAVIFEALKRQGEQVATLTAIPSSEYPMPAVRPVYSCLNNDKLKAAFNVEIGHWEERIQKLMQELD